MRLIPVLATALVLIAVPLAAPATAKQGCPAGMKLECKQQSYPPKQPAPCRCVVDPNNPGSGNSGKAEVKKSNVPQVRKSKSPGPND